ncbi:LON peptidase substrate-binding domain-containing protein [Bernardetia sp.]|uniref:LON peptidase substrate-binding domain-containing protein n=1 Tax=Bernardetia sp. TaxID=1937974 RepID=UPI0025BBD091|nr:LON peptidase substrate-binding domain-containing protein [Bernardetia sp.]
MLPLFPLNLIVFPNEPLNLHIFEPRYRQLISDCIENKQTFGIPPFLNEKLQDYGAEIELVEIARRHTDGRMDIKTKCVGAFKMLSYYNPAPNKLYAGGEIERIIHTDSSTFLDKEKILAQTTELWQLVKAKADVPTETEFLSFKIAHKIGLSLEQEYDLLRIADETERLELISRHLDNIIPIIREVERTKERIRMNGHFKNFDELNF